MTTNEALMTKEVRITNLVLSGCWLRVSGFIRHSDLDIRHFPFGFPSAFGFRHSSFFYIISEVFPAATWEQIAYAGAGLVGLVGVAGLVLGVAEKARKVFARNPAADAAFASRDDLKEQEHLLKTEIREWIARLEQHLEDAELRHARAIGALHEKVNKVAEDTAYLRGKIEERFI